MSLKEDLKNWVNSYSSIVGPREIDEFVSRLAEAGRYYKISNAERRLRELAHDGEIESFLSNGLAHYRAKKKFELNPLPKPQNFPSKAHEIAHENSLKREAKTDQLTLI